jgi:hypothetical protein
MQCASRKRFLSFIGYTGRRMNKSMGGILIYKLVVAHIVKKFYVFMGPWVSLSYSHVPGTGPSPEPDNPVHTTSYFLKIYFNIILPPVRKSVNGIILPSGFPTKSLCAFLICPISQLFHSPCIIKYRHFVHGLDMSRIRNRSANICTTFGVRNTGFSKGHNLNVKYFSMSCCIAASN